MKSMKNSEVEPYNDEESNDDETSGHTYNALLRNMLERYLVKVADIIITIRNLQVGELAQRELLVQRWIQIQAQLERSIGS